MAYLQVSVMITALNYAFVNFHSYLHHFPKLESHSHTLLVLASRSPGYNQHVLVCICGEICTFKTVKPLI